MGSTMKRSIFDEQTSKALKKWHKKAVKKKDEKERSPTRVLGGSPGDSPMHSPMNNNHKRAQSQPDDAANIMACVNMHQHHHSPPKTNINTSSISTDNTTNKSDDYNACYSHADI